MGPVNVTSSEPNAAPILGKLLHYQPISPKIVRNKLEFLPKNVQKILVTAYEVCIVSRSHDCQKETRYEVLL